MLKSLKFHLYACKSTRNLAPIPENPARRQSGTRQRWSGLALVLTLLLTLLCGQFWSGPVTEAHGGGLKVAVVGSLPVSYEEYGSGIPILMLHGSPLDHYQMVGDMEPIFKKRAGFRRIYPDLPGMGKTPGPAEITTQDQMMQVMVDFMQKVAPNQRYLVAGFSYGGYLARGMVNKYGDRLAGVLLWAPLVETDPARIHLPPRTVIVENPQFIAALTPLEQGIPLSFTVVQSLGILKWLRANFENGFISADLAFLRKLAPAFSFPVDSLTTPFPGPSLVITGRQDSVTGFRNAMAILDNFPRGTYAVLDRSGHFLAYEQVDLFRSLTLEWLNRVKESLGKSTRLEE